MPSTQAPKRPRLSDEFLKANTRTRIVRGTALVIAERGYHAAKIADITSACRVARNTFYRCFSGKEEAALGLVAELDLDIETLSESKALDVLLIEIAAAHHAEARPTAAEIVGSAERLIDFLRLCNLGEFPAKDDPRQQSLPPGRHGLSADFLRENQRTRLLSGLAASVAAVGYRATTIESVCREAAVSRRTFYEHFGSLDEAAVAAVVAAVPADEWPATRQPGSGLGAVVVEIVAQRIVEGESKLAEEAGVALGTMAEAIVE